MYFHTDQPATINFIAQVATRAAEQGQRLRIDVDSEGNLRIKRGEGVWSAPIPSTDDPYRDAQPKPRTVLFETKDGFVEVEL